MHLSVYILYFNRVLRTKKVKPGWESSIMTGSIEIVESAVRRKD